ncbi:hypothetical protein ACWGDX_24045 [Streptomyces sp. NPDC055025]
MAERTLTPGSFTAVTDDIRDHGYAIVQTRIERVPAHYRSSQCAEPDGCSRTPALVTVALAEVTNEGNDTTGLRFARTRDGRIALVGACEEHRREASHDLYYALTGRTRPDGIRAFDLPGQYLNWT